jgi:malonyl-CoA O-methyltransferase
MDSARVTLTYPSPRALLDELRRVEGGNLAARRPRGLSTPRRLAAVSDAYAALPGAREPGGTRIRATLELVFAHAWSGGAERARASTTTEVAAPIPPTSRRARGREPLPSDPRRSCCVASSGSSSMRTSFDVRRTLAW